MGTKESRERNQNWFLFKFKEAYKKGRYLAKKKLLASFCLEMHASQRTAKEICTTYEDFGLIKIHKDRIEVLR